MNQSQRRVRSRFTDKHDGDSGQLQIANTNKSHCLIELSNNQNLSRFKNRLV